MPSSYNNTNIHNTNKINTTVNKNTNLSPITKRPTNVSNSTDSTTSSSTLNDNITKKKLGKQSSPISTLPNTHINTHASNSNSTTTISNNDDSIVTANAFIDYIKSSNGLFHDYLQWSSDFIEPYSIVNNTTNSKVNSWKTDYITINKFGNLSIVKGSKSSNSSINSNSNNKGFQLQNCKLKLIQDITNNNDYSIIQITFPHNNTDPKLDSNSINKISHLYLHQSSRLKFKKILYTLLWWASFKNTGIFNKLNLNSPSLNNNTISTTDEHNLLVCQLRVYGPLPINELNRTSSNPISLIRTNSNSSNIASNIPNLSSNLPIPKFLYNNQNSNTENNEKLTSSIREGWFNAMGVLKDNGQLDLISQTDGSIIYTLNISKLLRSEIRILDKSLLKSDKFLFLGILKKLRQNLGLNIGHSSHTDLFIKRPSLSNTNPISKSNSNINVPNSSISGCNPSITISDHRPSTSPKTNSDYISNQRLILNFPLRVDLEDWFVALNALAIETTLSLKGSDNSNKLRISNKFKLTILEADLSPDIIQTDISKTDPYMITHPLSHSFSDFTSIQKERQNNITSVQKHSIDAPQVKINTAQKRPTSASFNSTSFNTTHNTNFNATHNTSFNTTNMTSFNDNTHDSHAKGSTLPKKTSTYNSTLTEKPKHTLIHNKTNTDPSKTTHTTDIPINLSDSKKPAPENSALNTIIDIETTNRYAKSNSGSSNSTIMSGPVPNKLLPPTTTLTNPTTNITTSILTITSTNSTVSSSASISSEDTDSSSENYVAALSDITPMLTSNYLTPRDTNTPRSAISSSNDITPDSTTASGGSVTLLTGTEINTNSNLNTNTTTPTIISTPDTIITPSPLTNPTSNAASLSNNATKLSNGITSMANVTISTNTAIPLAATLTPNIPTDLDTTTDNKTPNCSNNVSRITTNYMSISSDPTTPMKTSTNTTFDMITPSQSFTTETASIYLSISMWDHIWAKTPAIESNPKPFWREEFEFSELLPIDNLLIELWETYPLSTPITSTPNSSPQVKKKRKEKLLGYLSLNQDIINNLSKDCNLIRLPILSVSDKTSNIGTLCLKVDLNLNFILPYANFVKLEKCLKTLPLENLANLIYNHDFKENFKINDTSKILLDVFQVLNRQNCWFEQLMEKELSDVNNSINKIKNSSATTSVKGISNSTSNIYNTLFRGNSVLTKSLEKYFFRVGTEYLDKSVGSTLRKIISQNKSCEIDKQRYDSNLSPEEKEKTFDRNKKHLMYYIKDIWKNIYNTSNDLPIEIKIQLTALRKKLELLCIPDSKQENKPNVIHPTILNCISSILILRFFCPVILNPKLFDFVENHLTDRPRRTLTLISKLLLNLSNQTTFGNKEPWLICMNEFINDHKDEFIDYVEKITEKKLDFTPKKLKLYSIKGRQKLELNYEIIHNLPSIPFLIDRCSRETELVHLIYSFHKSQNINNDGVEEKTAINKDIINQNTIEGLKVKSPSSSTSSILKTIMGEQPDNDSNPKNPKIGTLAFEKLTENNIEVFGDEMMLLLQDDTTPPDSQFEYKNISPQESIDKMKHFEIESTLLYTRIKKLVYTLSDYEYPDDNLLSVDLYLNKIVESLYFTEKRRILINFNDPRFIQVEGARKIFAERNQPSKLLESTPIAFLRNSKHSKSSQNKSTPQSANSKSTKQSRLSKLLLLGISEEKPLTNNKISRFFRGNK
ncbi:hypothetical protein TBLA_0B05530 [Henningerozyma blattae CBS 6284]|uniref:Ras-GAP domain-containing protein n=1 Tax=Henningerozyma blattae (strain ATCC 34711 / CBS 6284 / DSM 70876 / NBRC 10599 / NRRL Y-10934 / UCD 77-7) TaxID=1071380 RepID=I2GZ29_HENB6|nr:hypothetical protein TBLA_0B05530 [Tetrapisispora blattae CBS 6284]CCH59381.1 hypothetical protein TBLA_0B05530 [Tetrapisispora blattae CBS 6284]